MMNINYIETGINLDKRKQTKILQQLCPKEWKKH